MGLKREDIAGGAVLIKARLWGGMDLCRFD